jgi:hypothetical protein
MPAHRPVAYLRTDCPYSFKLLLFLTEAKLLERFEIVRCDPDTATFVHIKRKLEQATGKNAMFPTVEISPNTYMSDSDALIAHYAKSASIDPQTLPAFSFYMNGIFPQLAERHG